MGRFAGLVAGDHWPVFDGLARTRVSGRDIAAIAGVSPRTVRDWSRGRVRVPPERLALLTLVLEDALEETERLHAGFGAGSRDWRTHVGDRLETIRSCLRDQIARNRALPADAVLQGCRLFRGWARGRGAGVAPSELRRHSRA